jgi:hypothetical protein
MMENVSYELDHETGKIKNMRGTYVKELILKVFNTSNEMSDRQAACCEVYTIIMTLSMENLREQAKINRGEKDTVLHDAVGGLNLPLLAIDRLVEAVGVNSLDGYGSTVIMAAAVSRNTSMILSPSSLILSLLQVSLNNF